MPVRGAECQTPSYSPPRAVAVGCAYGAKGDAYGVVGGAYDAEGDAYGVVGGAYDAEGDAYGAVGGAYDARAARMAPLVLVARMTPRAAMTPSMAITPSVAITPGSAVAAVAVVAAALRRRWNFRRWRLGLPLESLLPFAMIDEWGDSRGAALPPPR